MNRTLLVTGWMLLASLGCRGVGRSLIAPPEAPEVVARRYLELGGRNDLAGARALVVPDCQRGPLGEVDAVKMMGARMTVTRVETSVQSQSPTSAMVRYTVSGSVHAEHGTTTLFGAQVQINGVNIDHANQSGTLHMVKPQDRWLVTCHD